MAQRLSFSFLRACRFGILLFFTAVLLQLFSVSAAEYHPNSLQVPGSSRRLKDGNAKLGCGMENIEECAFGACIGSNGATRTDYYLRGKMEGRQLEETSSFEADAVDVADYSPCANDKHDRSLCKHPGKHPGKHP